MSVTEPDQLAVAGCRACEVNCCARVSDLGLVLLASESATLAAEDSPGLVKASEKLRVLTGPCPAFKPPFTCGIYDRRPLECAIYPLFLAWFGGRAVWLLHRSCPGAATIDEHFIVAAEMQVQNRLQREGVSVEQFAVIVSGELRARAIGDWVFLRDALV